MTTHNINPAHAKPKSPLASRILIGLGVIIGGIITLLIVAAIVLFTAIETGFVPDTMVQTGDEISTRHLEQLREARVLKRGETVQYYYSEGFLDIAYGGTVMTDKRIIGYWTEDESVEVLAYPLTSIVELVETEAGSEYVDAVYEITPYGDEDDYLILVLSVEDDLHLGMISALEKHIAENLAKNAVSEE